MYIKRKIHLFLRLHWLKLVIGIALAMLIILAVVGLASMEKFTRNITLAQLPITLLVGIMHAAIFVFMYMVVLRGGMMGIKNKAIKGAMVNINFDDVIGIDEPKAEAWEMVALIKDRTRLHKIGGRILRGLLMVGPPGCGKTYLAKAIATESGLPFLSMAASEFNEMFVGVGASRVRSLFKKARNLAYAHGGCIVFIDEIDAIARSRTFSIGGGGAETNATQNQLLVEMDGLSPQNDAIIVIGATNADEGVLDTALLRPGRFDRKIYISFPNVAGREKVFEFYLSKVKHDPKLDIGRLARKALYKSPADIENIVKEAALIATRNGSDLVTHKDMTEAMDRIDLGIKHKLNMTKKEREETAYHESGHLLVTYLLHPTNDVFKASIIPRRGSLGVVMQQPREELHSANKNMVLANIKVALGGYLAEKLVFGTTSTGVAADFKVAMQQAHTMVWKLGMGDSGIMGDYTAIPHEQLSDSMIQKLNEETQKVFQKCTKDVEDIFEKERGLLELFAKELLDREELEYDDIEEIVKKYEKSIGRKVTQVNKLVSDQYLASKSQYDKKTQESVQSQNQESEEKKEQVNDSESPKPDSSEGK